MTKKEYLALAIKTRNQMMHLCSALEYGDWTISCAWDVFGGIASSHMKELTTTGREEYSKEKKRLDHNERILNEEDAREYEEKKKRFLNHYKNGEDL